ncbi:MAG: lysophospholipid acyltransferase family protein [Terriglobales bacterium]
MIRSLLTLAFYSIATPLAALLAFPWTFLTGRINFLYRVGVGIAWAGVRIAGIRVDIVGRERLDPARAYVFMANHASNVDPPILMYNLPGRTSVLVKQELFRIPILGRAMRMGSLVPVDRSNRERAIASLRAAAEVLRAGIHMMVFVEGTRSPDGGLLPFKKGPFYLALETGAPIVPVTIVGTHKILPKGKILAKPGRVTLAFHEPVNPQDFSDVTELMAVVRERIASGLTMTR